MTFISEPSADDLLAFRFVSEAQRRADAKGRDVRIMLAKVIIGFDPEAAARWLDEAEAACEKSAGEA